MLCLWILRCEVQAHVNEVILCLPQPLGSFPHVCAHSTVRLSGGSQLHLGDSEAGLQEDPLPGKSVWSVQPQLLLNPESVTRCSYSAADTGRDWPQLVPCIDGVGASAVWSSKWKPRIYEKQMFEMNNYFTEPQMFVAGQSVSVFH